MISLSVFLRVFALVCFILAAFGVPTSRVNAVALGLAAWILSTFVII